MQTKIVHGQAVTPHIADLARLRTTVFRAFPYLYEGSEDYEASYLATYAQSPESLFVLVLDGERIVGASTGVPMPAPIWPTPYRPFPCSWKWGPRTGRRSA